MKFGKIQAGNHGSESVTDNSPRFTTASQSKPESSRGADTVPFRCSMSTQKESFHQRMPVWTALFLKQTTFRRENCRKRAWVREWGMVPRIFLEMIMETVFLGNGSLSKSRITARKDQTGVGLRWEKKGKTVLYAKRSDESENKRQRFDCTEAEL